MNIGGETDDTIDDNEKDIIYEAVKTPDDKASVKNLEELCDYIENELLKEEKGLNIVKENQELDLQKVNLGFESDSEPEEWEGEKSGMLEESKEDGGEKLEEKGKSKKKGFLKKKAKGKNDENVKEFEDRELEKIQNLEDAKDHLLEATENLTLGLAKASNFRYKK